MKVAIAQIQEYITPAKINWFRRQLSAWALQNLRDFPWRRTSNPYDLFIAEFMLQKTDAQTVAPIYEAFLDRYPTLQELTAATVEDIAQILKPLGLFFRAERLYQSAQIILDKYEGKIPDSEKLLLELPGIGIYTARSICSQAFDQPLAILDTNVALDTPQVKTVWILDVVFRRDGAYERLGNHRRQPLINPRLKINSSCFSRYY